MAVSAGRLLLRTVFRPNLDVDKEGDWTQILSVTLEDGLFLVDHYFRIASGLRDSDLVAIILSLPRLDDLFEFEQFVFLQSNVLLRHVDVRHNLI